MGFAEVKRELSTRANVTASVDLGHNVNEVQQTNENTPPISGKPAWIKGDFKPISGELLWRLKSGFYTKLVYNMSEVFTPLCDVDPMSERIKVKARCVSIWRSHAPGKPTPVRSLDCVIQDEQGNRIQCTIRKDGMPKYEGLLQEGVCYRISNFGVGENGGKYPLLKHKIFMNYGLRNFSTRQMEKLRLMEYGVGSTFICKTSDTARSLLLGLSLLDFSAFVR
ncbi:hypothetical protein CTI12_AA137290 [Artemisia annua]|uniref:Replication protein A 70 kDa DNA-binding subunit B/D first OB fold domain-containing protein n=1 Tax=Artemisia annua TaxID=35608 RepID=A0A2U1PJK5_ARTAN|nr:hypothetical protein CTI12_AA137290 [Artemisia annua]